jgi:hypothetical protein
MPYYWFRVMFSVNDVVPINGVTLTKIVKVEELSVLLVESQII